jgi:hypothetical protein
MVLVALPLIDGSFLFDVSARHLAILTIRQARRPLPAGLIAPGRRREPCQVFFCKPLHRRQIAAKTHGINLVK